MTRAAQCPNGVSIAVTEKQMDAREFDPNDLSDPARRNMLINSESVKKTRTKIREMKFIGKTDFFLYSFYSLILNIL